MSNIDTETEDYACACGEPELSWKELDRAILDIHRAASTMRLTEFVEHLYHLAYSAGARDADIAAANRHAECCNPLAATNTEQGDTP